MCFDSIYIYLLGGEDMSRAIKFKGNTLNLAGRDIKTGVIAPDFKVISKELDEVNLQSFKGKLKIITSFPSIDTPVCDLQVKEFNKKASEMDKDVAIIGISKDLPFAQKRFCEMNNIDRVKVFSDYRYSSFGINYGFLVKELNLLARTIVIVDKNDVIRYIQIVEELTNQPDYNDALRNLEDILKGPALNIAKKVPSKCKPCESGVLPLQKDEINKLLAQHRGWDLMENKKLVKAFKFKSFMDAKYFVDLLAIIAEEQGHHPTITIIYDKVKITLTTHAAGGLTENDFIMARIIDELV